MRIQADAKLPVWPPMASRVAISTQLSNEADGWRASDGSYRPGGLLWLASTGVSATTSGEV